MKKSLGVLSLMALVLGISASAQAQLFQNSNTACESEVVPCDSVSGLNCISGDISSVSCKNASGSAMFTNSGFVDCALSTPARSAQSLPEPVAASVLINKGASATSCASGSGDQFNSSLDYAFSSFAGASAFGFGSVVVGNIDGSNFSDMEIPGLDDNLSDAVTAPSLVGGGFGADESTLTTTGASWQSSGGQTGFATNVSDRTNALIDCDGAGGPLDLVFAAGDTAGNFSVNVLLNNGTGLDPVSSTEDTGISTGGAPTSGSISVGDFNNDGLQDVVAVFGTASVNRIIVGINDGACGFTFSPAGGLDLATAHSGTLPVPRTVVAGDFNGDGNLDAAISEPALASGTRGVHYYFGNGSTSFSFASNTHVSFNNTPNDATPSALAVGCFNNDNVDDLAGTFAGPGTGGGGNVQVVNSDGAGGLESPANLSFGSTVFALNNSNVINGIDAANFDGQGGDDIMAVVSDFNNNNTRTAYVFMNAVETVEANAGADVSRESSGSLQLSGTCAVNPADESAAFDVAWTIVSSPAGASLANADTLTPTLTTTAEGVYTLQLSCTTQCDSTATDTVVVTVGSLGILEGSGVFLGGCSFNPLASFSVSGLGMMFASLALFWSLRRRN